MSSGHALMIPMPSAWHIQPEEASARSYLWTSQAVRTCRMAMIRCRRMAATARGSWSQDQRMVWKSARNVPNSQGSMPIRAPLQPTTCITASRKHQPPICASLVYCLLHLAHADNNFPMLICSIRSPCPCNSKTMCLASHQLLTEGRRGPATRTYRGPSPSPLGRTDPGLQR